MPADRPLKVLLKSPFSNYSGYGNDGFALLRALHEWGCDVYPQPVWLDVPIPRDLLPLFGRELVGPFDLLINHWDPGHLVITREARAMSRVAVGWSMWEFSSPEAGPGSGLPGPEWAAGHDDGRLPLPTTLPVGRISGLVPMCEDRDKLAESWQWFDLLLGYDQVSADAFESYLSPHTAGGILQGGYDSRAWKRTERDWFADRFGFIMHGALNNRKCPWTAIEAFTALKHEQPAFAGATLALHTSAPGLIFPELNGPFGDLRIRVFVEAFSKATLDDFYASAHCLLSPSRGEGKNLPALEFQTTGGVVAATNFGGHRQWLSGDWAYPLDYRLTPTFPQYPWAAHDAKVSVEHMKAVMWDIYTHRDEAKRKAALAAEMIPKLCDWPVVLENLFRRIRDTVPSRGLGAQVYDLAMGCRREAEAEGQPLLAPGGWGRR